MNQFRIARSVATLGIAVIVACIVCALCLWRIGETSISISDESLHVKVTQEIFQKGNWWSPTLSGTPYYSKPPFKMWLACLPLYLLGESNFSYRILDGLLGVACCLLLSLLVWQLFRSFWGALLAPLALLCNYQFLLGAHGVRRATQDAMLEFLTLLIFLLGVKWWQAPATKSLRYATGIGFCSACAVLTKSVAGLIPLVLVIGFCLSNNQALTFLKRERLNLGLALLVLVIPVSAYYLPHFLFTDGYYQLSVNSEIVNRIQDGYHNADKPAYYFRQILRGSFGPPFALLIGAIAFCLMKYWRKEQGRFLLLTILLPLVAFSIIPSRLAWYLSAAYPGLAILCLFPWMLNFERDFHYKNLLFAMRSFCLLVVALHLAGHIARVRRPLPRAAFDLALQAIRDKPDLPLYVHGPGLRMEHPHLNRVEKIYLASLRERLHLFSKLEELPNPDEPIAVLLPSNESEKLLTQRNPTSFTKLPHARHGKLPLMLLAFGTRIEGSGFVSKPSFAASGTVK